MLLLPSLESLVLTTRNHWESCNSNIVNDNTNSYLGQKWKWPFKNTNSNAKNVIQWLGMWEPRFNTQACWRTHLADKTSSPANRATTFFCTIESTGILLRERESREGQSPSTLRPSGRPSLIVSKAEIPVRIACRFHRKYHLLQWIQLNGIKVNLAFWACWTADKRERITTTVLATELTG